MASSSGLTSMMAQGGLDDMLQAKVEAAALHVVQAIPARVAEAEKEGVNDEEVLRRVAYVELCNQVKEALEALGQADDGLKGLAVERRLGQEVVRLLPDYVVEAEMLKELMGCASCMGKTAIE